LKEKRREDTTALLIIKFKVQNSKFKVQSK
jgi:hypothetical protein